MTDTTTSPVEVAPPRDYGHGDTWAPPGDEYHVPEHLRLFYAAAEPTKVELDAYVANGVQVSEPRVVGVDRVVSRGDDTNPPVIATEPTTRTFLRDLRGAEGFRLWLHHARVHHALNAKRGADQRAAREATWQTCEVCGSRSASVTRTRYPVPTPAGQTSVALLITVCPDHRGAVDEATRQAVAAHRAAQTLTDGRRVGDVAAGLVATKLASLTEKA